MGIIHIHADECGIVAEARAAPQAEKRPLWPSPNCFLVLGGGKEELRAGAGGRATWPEEKLRIKPDIVVMAPTRI